jgi:hypothetical protein
MRQLPRAVSLLVTAVLGVALVASAAGTPGRGPKAMRLRVSAVEALALDGSRVAYDVAKTRSRSHGKLVTRPNRVFVWNLRTGHTINVSGKRGTGADYYHDHGTAYPPRSYVSGLAIAGTRVAWLIEWGDGNQTGGDKLYTSSLQRPKVQLVATEERSSADSCGGQFHGGPCTGTYLGSLVGGGNLIAVNRWTFNGGSFSDGWLYALNGTKLMPLATGGDTIWAADAGPGRVVMLRDAQVSVYSSTGAPLISVSPQSYPQAWANGAAISGRNLVVFESGAGAELATVYDAGNGRLLRTFVLHGSHPADVQGNIAVYATASLVKKHVRGAIHAFNLSSGKDRVIGRLPRRIIAARINSYGLVYSSRGTIVFLPFKQVAAAVS